jgi:hypothetical protein
MGSCCFAPTKRDFLWWYWFVLVSIVGIPMLAAVLYVASCRAGDEEKKRRRGRTAAWIFWAGTALIAIPLVAIVTDLLRSPRGDARRPVTITYDWPVSGADTYPVGELTLGVQFFAAIVAANGANELTRKRKRWYVRLSLLVLSMAVYLLALMALGLAFDRPAVNVMQFLACMLPAHFWGGFKDSPSQFHAWRALAAFVVAALLFFLVTHFGEGFAQWVCGSPGGFGPH